MVQKALLDVAGLEDELRHVVVTLSHIAEMFPIGVAPEDLVTAMQNKCGALVARLKALASSAPLVAAHNAKIEAAALEDAANAMENNDLTFNDLDGPAVWLRARAEQLLRDAVPVGRESAELRKQAGGQ